MFNRPNLFEYDRGWVLITTERSGSDILAGVGAVTYTSNGMIRFSLVHPKVREGEVWQPSDRHTFEIHGYHQPLSEGEPSPDGILVLRWMPEGIRVVLSKSEHVDVQRLFAAVGR